MKIFVPILSLQRVRFLLLVLYFSQFIARIALKVTALLIHLFFAASPGLFRHKPVRRERFVVIISLVFSSQLEVMSLELVIVLPKSASFQDPSQDQVKKDN